MSDRLRWQERYAAGDRPDKAPSRWVVETARRLPNDGMVADLAGGTGRHAMPLARAGRTVVLLDFVEMAVRRAREQEPSILGIVGDVARLPLAPGAFAIVMLTNFLDRSIADSVVELIAPGGALICETYGSAHAELVRKGAARGPSSPAYLAEPGELPRLFAMLEILEHNEREVRDEAGMRYSVQLLARRPA